MRGRRDHLGDRETGNLRRDIIAGFSDAYLTAKYDLALRTVQTHRAKIFGPAPIKPNSHGGRRVKLPKIRHPSEIEDDEPLSAVQADKAAPVPKTQPKPNALPWCTKELLTAGRARPARCRREPEAA